MKRLNGLNALENDILNLINEFGAITAQQIRDFLATVGTSVINNAIEKLMYWKYIKYFFINGKRIFVPINFDKSEEYFSSSEYMQMNKSITLLLHLKKRNKIINFYSAKEPSKIVFIVEMKNDNKIVDKKVFYIMYVAKNNETVMSLLADRLLYIEEEDSLSPMIFVIVEDKKQIPNINIKNVIAYYTVSDFGGVEKIEI